MAKEKLTATGIERTKLPPGKAEVTLSDGDGLYLRVRRAADGRQVVRQWIFATKVGGKLRKVGLGGYEATPLAAAREKAARLRAARDAGGRPTASEANVSLRTFGDLYAHFERTQPAAAGREEAWRIWVEPALGRTKLEDLTRARLTGLLDSIAAEGRRRVAAGGNYDLRRTAGRIFNLLRQLTSFAATRGLLAADPMAGLKRKDFGHQGVPRERVLTAAEIAELSRRFARELRVGPPGREFTIPPLHPGAQAAVFFLLATMARVGELAAMTVSQIDFEKATWTIPAAVAKNRREHIVHLSPFALRMVEAMRRLPSAPPRGSSKPQDTVFYGGDSLAKALHDRQQPEGTQRAGRRAARSVLLLPGGKFTPHDLRRSGASLMQSLGVRSEVIERCLNHTPPALVAVYQRDPLLDDRRRAFEALGARLAEIVDTTGIDRALARAER
jgi:integrase